MALTGFFLLSGAAGAPAQPAHVAPAPVLPAYPVRLTAYNAVTAQTDSNPLVTASGAVANPAVVAARSRDLAEELPFGTVIALTGPERNSDTCGFSNVEHFIGYRVIADTMNARFTKSVDVLLPTVAAARTLGVCDINVVIIGHIDLSNPALLPKTQKELATLLSGNDPHGGLALDTTTLDLRDVGLLFAR